MGIFNSKETEQKKAHFDKERQAKSLESILMEGEEVANMFLTKNLGSNSFVAMTNRRILFSSKSKLTQKESLYSAGYSKIDYVALQTVRGLVTVSEVEVGIKGKDFSMIFMSQQECQAFVKAITPLITE